MFSTSIHSHDNNTTFSSVHRAEGTSTIFICNCKSWFFPFSHSFVILKQSFVQKTRRRFVIWTTCMRWGTGQTFVRFLRLTIFQCPSPPIQVYLHPKLDPVYLYFRGERDGGIQGDNQEGTWRNKGGNLEQWGGSGRNGEENLEKMRMEPRGWREGI